jgi:hypothetical protein
MRSKRALHRSIGAALEALEGRQLLAANPVYLSDLQPATTPTNGWGPIELDHSNGEMGANDGRTLSLNGQTFAKGLGVHANSEATFNIPAGYDTFNAVIGVDDEVGNNGSVVFQVWLNGTNAYTSPVLTGSQAGVPISVPLSSATQIELVVLDGGNGNTFDHADWADAKLMPSASSVPTVTAQTQDYLAGESASTGFGIFRVTRDGQTTNPLSVNFTLSGSATRGSDYQLELIDGTVITGNSVTIPAGNGSLEVRVRGLDDSVYDPNEHVVFTLASSSDYAVGSPNSGDVTIIDNETAPSGTYLSDLPVVSSSNGWGPIELDRSNGETGASDGHTLTLNGVTYAKGIGAHANSEVTFNIPAGYDTFNAVIGIDDEVGNNGSAVFQVWLNGTNAYTSPVLTGSQAGVPISIPLSTATQIKLVVLDGGNGNTFDHADWADAKLIPSASGSPTVTAQTQGYLSEERPVAGAGGYELSRSGQTTNPLTVNFVMSGSATRGVDYQLEDQDGHVITGNSVTFPAGVGAMEVYVRGLDDTIPDPDEHAIFNLASGTGYTVGSPNSGDVTILDNDLAVSGLDPTSAQNGWGPYERNRSNGETGANDGHTLTLNGVQYASGLGVHANSDISYSLFGLAARRFHSDIGVDDEVGNNGSVIFQVYVDGVKKFDSGLMTGSSPTQNVDLDLTNASTLRLVVTDGGNGNAFDHADWANAAIST